MTQQVWDAIEIANEPGPKIFDSPNGLVRLEFDQNGRAQLTALTADRLIHEISLVADCGRVGRNSEWQAARLQRDVVRNMLASAAPPVPYVERVVRYPYLSRDGSLVQEDGYRPDDRVLVDLPEDLEEINAIEEPAQKEVARSCDFLIKNLFGDFPFESDTDLANLFAALLTPFLLFFIRDVTPLFLIDKSGPGVGGTLLTGVIAKVLGVDPLLFAPPAGQAEWQRTLLGAARSQPDVLLIDNADTLDSPALAVVLTSGQVAGRLTGGPDVVRSRCNSLWMATGNNVTLSRELLRRAVWIRLTSELERPETRTGFLHPKLLAWISRHRRKLVKHILTIIQGWVRAGCPKGTVTLGSFESWAETVGGIVEFIELPGFLENRNRHAEVADTEGAFRGFVSQWAEMHSESYVSVGNDLYQLAGELDLGEGSAQQRKIRLGKMLSRYRGRPVAGYVIQDAGRRGGVQTWRLRAAVVTNERIADSEADQRRDSAPQSRIVLHTEFVDY